MFFCLMLAGGAGFEVISSFCLALAGGQVKAAVGCPRLTMVVT